jgi:hypothetical protein
MEIDIQKFELKGSPWNGGSDYYAINGQILLIAKPTNTGHYCAVVVVSGNESSSALSGENAGNENSVRFDPFFKNDDTKNL